MRPRRGSTRPVHHWLLLVGLVLGLILQPVLASVGELHELSHGTAAEHATGNAANGDQTRDDAEDGAAGALHVVHHMAHCCAHAVATPGAPLTVTVIPRQTPLQLRPEPFVPGERLLAPFRPPISV